MNTQRLNITLPRDLASRLRKYPNRSAFIAEAVREKLAGEERNARNDRLANAYRVAAQEDEDLRSEWENVTGDAL
jgi:metal-responsive CopG/Arc/MetJ family transcriptional regulator